MIDRIHPNTERHNLFTHHALESNETRAGTKTKLFQHLALGYLDDNTTIYYGGVFYTYDGKCYRPEIEPTIAFIRWCQSQNIASSNSIASNVVEQIKGYTVCSPAKYPDIPFFVEGEDDPKKYIPFQNGLLDIEKYLAGETKIVEHTPDLVSLYVLPYDFDPDATCRRWLNFLDEVFQGDEESIRLLQEWFGYCLTADVSLQKLMTFVGLPRSGKGTTARVLRDLIGCENVTAFDLYRLLDKFSMSALRAKQLAVVGEVELTAAREKARILEKLKSVTGNDPQIMECKGIDVKESAVLPTRFLISCNQMPHLHDVSGALEARMLLLKFNRTFAGNENPNLANELLPELSGIANWAIRGLSRLRNSSWSKPATSTEAKKAFRKESSIPLAFLQECCMVQADWLTPLTPDVEPLHDDGHTTRKDLAAVFRLWAQEEEIDATYHWFGRDVKAIIPQLGGEKRVTINGKRVRVVQGIAIKAEWRARVMDSRRKA